MPGTVLLTLTPQSFKLADLYSLAADMERGPATGDCERLFVDSGTGSALLRMNVHPPLPAKEENKDPHSRSSATCTTTRSNACSSWWDHLENDDDINHSDTVPLPMFLQRSQWTGRVLASGSNAKEFLHHIRHGGDDNTPHWTRTVRHPWTLRYVCLGDHPPHERPTHRPHTANMLLCATAQALGFASTKHSHPPPPFRFH